ncbi:hypothetical protein D9756_009207 [Leucocoprinus leucothites]|uniref:Uncharacterized protein n=1 Tax=Leucocoprinus leucothites TaxID=201217 RepID=A0A8H5FV96_9AGAR|nr:hypothetical protein D9756_009207 [Leucoagaricus leucothites]
MSNDLANPSFPAEVNRVLGPIVIASLVNAVIYGACVVQFWTYYTSKMEKNWRINVLVNWVFILDTFHTIALCYMLWEYTVTNFNNPTYLLTADWPFLITPVTLNLRQSLREELELQHLPSVLIPVTRDSQRMMGSIQTIPYSVSDAASYGRGNVPSTEGAGVTPSLLEDGRNK